MALKATHKPKTERVTRSSSSRKAIAVSAALAVATAHKLFALVDADRDRVAGIGPAAASAVKVHHALKRQPPALRPNWSAPRE